MMDFSREFMCVEWEDQLVWNLKIDFSFTVKLECSRMSTGGIEVSWWKAMWALLFPIESDCLCRRSIGASSLVILFA